MGENNPPSEENCEKNTRRNLLKVAAAGATGLSFSSVATADDSSGKGRGPVDAPPNQNSGSHGRRPGRRPEGVSQRDPEEIFGEEITEMSDEELDRKADNLWEEGMGSDSSQLSLQMEKNCLTDVLDIENLPAIEVDVCALDNACGVEVTVGIFGVTDSARLESCSRYCRNIKLNALAETVDLDVCYDHYASEVEFSVEHCSWRPRSGWNCSTGNGTIDTS